MRVVIVYDNTIYRKDLQADWGFSCLIEAENIPRILFDTGSDGSILLSNMKKLGIDPNSIEEIFISHAHGDHTGGLSDLLKVNKKAKIYVPSSFVGIVNNRMIVIKEARQIHENVFTTGELKGIEQSMIVKADKGLVVIVGCSHPGVKNILDAASKFGKVYALIGGLHGFNEFDVIKNLELICPTHCTMYKAEIKKLYPGKYVEGGAGRIIEI